MNFLALFAALFLGVGYSLSAQATFMPPNDLHLEDDLHRKDANMTEAEFNEILQRGRDVFTSIVKLHGAELRIEGEWTSPLVSAFAKKANRETIWIVKMYGGLARRPEISADGFTMILCHELGHHLAGHYFYPWKKGISVEGQADYYSTHACTRELWKDEITKNEMYRNNVDPYVKKLCDASWVEENDQNMCYRAAIAGLGMTQFLARNEAKKPAFHTPSKVRKKYTVRRHPAPQCRLDTLLAGATCTKKFDLTVIPGVILGKDKNSKEGEEHAAQFSCSHTEYDQGVRPTCWFKSQLQ